MKIPEGYINEVIIKYKHKPITREMIIKDLILSYILYGMFNKENEVFNKLIFKGGTLLSKSFLKYHRISEDLDFTFRYNKDLNKKTKSQKRKEIKEYIKQNFLPELKKICDFYNLDFENNEINDSLKNNRYCPIKSNDLFFRFNIYENKQATNPIKIEISFIDELKYTPKLVKINNLNSNSNYLIYPLKNTKILSYVKEEIILEKIRAIITRKEGIHERDIFDLFLLEKKEKNILNIKEKDIQKKLKNSISWFKNKKDITEIIGKLEERFKEIESNLESEIKDLILIDYKPNEYIKFFYDLKKFILNIKLN